MLVLILFVLLMAFVLIVKLDTKKAPVIYEFEDEKGLYYSIEESPESRETSRAA